MSCYTAKIVSKYHTSAIVGPWDYSFQFDQSLVRREVEQLMRQDGHLLSGGMSVVDFVAVDEALVFDSWAERIRIFLPGPLDVCVLYLQGLEKKKQMTPLQVKMVVAQLTSVENANPDAIITTTSDHTLTPDSFLTRNKALIMAADETIAFWDDQFKTIKLLRSFAEKYGKMFTVKKI